MFHRTLLLLSLSALSVGALASIPLYGQCGGDDIVWTDTCAEGLTCQYFNYWFSQCLPAAAASTSTGEGAKSTSTTAGAAAVPRSAKFWAT